MFMIIARMTSSTKILVGLVSGVLVGVFFGEQAAVLKVVADGFVKLLQMTVLPYITLSIITSLGTLSFDQVKTLGLRGGAVLVGLWCLALIFAFLLPLAFPVLETASFFSTTLVEQRRPFNFVELFIPSNPFYALSNNIVPAVVLFFLVFGVALIGVERKEIAIDVFNIAKEALSKATKFVVSLTPYGVFAIAANTAGTLNLEQIARIQVYLITYVMVALLIALWVLPGLVCALTPFGYKEMLGPTRDALITAFVAGDLFIVLPILIQGCKELLERHRLVDDQTRALPDVIVPTSCNFTHTGKLLSISFILFAGWFADAAVPLREYPKLALTGLLTFFGSLRYFIDVVKARAPELKLAVVNSMTRIEEGLKNATLDAAVLPAERGSVLSLLYPKYTVVVPEPGIIKIPLAYAVARRDKDFATFLNTWINLKRRDGTIGALYDHWILGKQAGKREPRWSVIRDVLHWVK
jgi:Na+/H+-dicarboxylate symporter